MDSATGKVTAGPEIHARGSGIDDAALVDVLPRIEDAIESAVADGMTDTFQLQQVVRRVVGRWVNDDLPPPADDHPARRRSLTALPD